MIILSNLLSSNFDLLMKNFLICMTFFGVLFIPLSIISQESDGIEEVIVTAEKKEANLQDVPTIIDVLTASQIEDMNIVRCSREWKNFERNANSKR